MGKVFLVPQMYDYVLDLKVPGGVQITSVGDFQRKFQKCVVLVALEQCVIPSPSPCCRGAALVLNVGFGLLN